MTDIFFGGIIMIYNRKKAVAYATEWAYGYNPKYYNFNDIGGDCTNFASQCLYAGGISMNYTPVFGWYYINLNNRAPAWTGVNELYTYLVSNEIATIVDLDTVEIGDLIQIDFNGRQGFDHTPIIQDVGDKTPQTVLVAAHSCPAFLRPLSTYEYSRIRCLHIIA